MGRILNKNGGVVANGDIHSLVASWDNSVMGGPIEDFELEYDEPDQAQMIRRHPVISGRDQMSWLGIATQGTQVCLSGLKAVVEQVSALSDELGVSKTPAFIEFEDAIEGWEGVSPVGELGGLKAVTQGLSTIAKQSADAYKAARSRKG